MTRRMLVLAAVAGLLASFAAAGTTSAAAPDLGPNVLVFDPGMPTSQIQAAVDAVASQQVPNQFGTQRYALLFKPGTYGTSTDPLNFQVGYYTSVAGLGQSPGDVVINGSVYVRNQCDGGSCIALNNFWRSLSNLTINVTTPGFGCYSGEFWPVSQAAPMRRVHVNGLATLMDYCTGPVVRERRLHRRFRRSTAAPSSTARSSSGWSGTARSTAGPTASGTRCSRASSARPPSASPRRRRAAARTRRSRRARSRARRPTCTWTPPGSTTSSSRRRRRHVGHDLGQRPDARPVDPDQASSSSPGRPTPPPRSTRRWLRARTSS